MKFNIKLLKNIAKILIIGFIIVYCIYILYFSTHTIVEGFFTTTNKDCSDCTMNPKSGDCIIINDFSDNIINSDNTEISFNTVGHKRYRFCKWQSNCDGNNNYLTNKNTDRSNPLLYNIQCCSGVDNPFYGANTLPFSEYTIVNTISEKCTKFSNDLSSIKISNNLQYTNLINNNYNNYQQINNICSTVQNPSNSTINGMLFDISLIETGHVLIDPNLTVQEILDYQNILEMSMNNYITGGYINTDQQNQEVTRLKNEIAEINKNLRSLEGAGFTIDQFETQKNLLQAQLLPYFVSTISYENYQYNLLDKRLNTTTYLLNENEFFDCFGEIKNVKSWDKDTNKYSDQNISGGHAAIFDKDDDINYFGADKNAGYKTSQEVTPLTYGPSMDLQGEFRRLESIPVGGNVPVNVINQYLTTINGFYEKQIKNLLGPKTHSFDQSLEFDNNSLNLKEKTFFVYENEENNKYDCHHGITGDIDFSYCGPDPYYNDVKF